MKKLIFGILFTSVFVFGAGTLIYKDAAQFKQTVQVDSLTASRALVSSAGKVLTSSATTATELGYVNGVTSAIQTQIDGKQTIDATITALAAYNTNGLLTQTASDTFTGRTITGTANQVNVSNGDGVSGNPTLSTPQDIHSGASPTFVTGTLSGLTASRAVVTDGSKVLTSSGTSATELGYVTGVTSAIQTQLDAKQAGPLTGDVTSSGAATTYAGVVPLNKGGTGNAAASANAAFNVLSPMTASGDIIYGGVSGAATRLAKGSDTQVLTLAAGIPSWAAAGSGGGASTYRSVTTTDSVGAGDETMALSGVSFTSTLPTAVGVAGKRYRFIHAGTSITNIYTLATTSSQTIGSFASGAYTLRNKHDYLSIESDGANWIVTGERTNSDKSYVLLRTGNGHGSTNTKIRIYSNSAVTGSDITYATSSTDGASLTIKTAARYRITMTDDKGVGGTIFGISVNSAALTTSIFAMTWANGYRASEFAASNSPGNLCVELDLAVNDVIRPHTDGGPNATEEAVFTISRIN